MTTTTTSPDPCTSVRTLRSRADRLTQVAHDEHPLIAQAYRRRASELQLEAWVREQVVEPTPIPVVDGDLVAA